MCLKGLEIDLGWNGWILERDFLFKILKRISDMILS